MKNESYYRDLKQRLEERPHGERTGLVKSAADMLGVTSKTIYANLKKVGYESGRKTRKDKGNSTISLEELKVIASLVRQSDRATKKQLMSIKLAIDVAYRSGHIKELYHETTIARLLRENQLASKQMKQATPHIDLKTSHPNELWELDPSICVLYYLKGGKKMAVMDADRFYDNKLENIYKIANDRVFRYVVSDHYSGAFYCKYYLARGENREILFDFLMSAMAEKDKQLNPFEGVPKMLYWDKGSANGSDLIKNLLDELGVKHSAHIRGNSRAKGQVEKTNDIIERNFESLLHLEQYKITSIESLNVYCEQWQRWFQSNPRYAHSRHGMPRFKMWRRITHTQLVTRPPIDVCKMILSEKEKECTVRGNYKISYLGEKYKLVGVDNIAIGGKVIASVNPYSYPNIRVKHPDRFGQMQTYDVEPLSKDAAGFDSDAVHASAMIDGHYHQAPMTQVDKNRQELDEIAYGTRDKDEIDKIRQKKSQPAFGGEMAFFEYIAEANEAKRTAKVQPMPKRGKPLDVGEPALQKIRTKRPSLETIKRDEEALPVLEFIKWFVKHKGKHTGMAERIRKVCGTHVKPSEYESIAQQLLNPTASNDIQLPLCNLKVM